MKIEELNISSSSSYFNGANLAQPCTLMLCSYQIVVKSLVSWEILAIMAHPQMPLANNGSAVASLLNILCYCGLIPG